jgi:DNA-directed RNA polymerase sigma subunit (sigma70/sigma32)
MIAGAAHKPVDRMERMAQRSLEHISADNEDGYRAQVARYPRLSSDEERRLLATRGAARDQANQRLIEHNLYLVYEAARARTDQRISFGDLFQEGTVGLISGVEHYRQPGPDFTSTLRLAIAATMDDIVAQTAEAQRNDQAFVSAAQLLEAAQRLLAERLERPATSAELAQLLKWEEARVNLILGMLGEARTLHDQELLDYLDDHDGEL